MFATHNSSTGRRVRRLTALTLAALIGCATGEKRSAGAEIKPNAPDSPVARAQRALNEAQRRHRSEPTNAVAAWKLSRACFDRAEFATDHAERAALANRGITAARQALARGSNAAPAHYYLGMNLGQLARTKTLGALKLVDQMEREFHLARALDERFDFAGPHRNLGLLYLEAPTIASVGDRGKARLHLQRAAELCPDYPENRLNLLEAYLRWNDRAEMRRELKAIEALWPAARTNFTGEAWVGAWRDWVRRREELARKAGEASSPPVSSSTKS